AGGEGAGVAAGGGVVPGRGEHLRVLEPAGGAGGHAARDPDLQPPLPGRRVPRPSRADGGALRRPRPGSVHARQEAPLPGSSRAGAGLERAPLHRLLLRPAGGAGQVTGTVIRNPAPVGPTAGVRAPGATSGSCLTVPGCYDTWGFGLL